MWVILQNNADWDCFKTPILREILRIQNLLQVEQCVFSKPHRNKLQSCTVRQNLKLFFLMQVYVWMEFPLSISGIWLLKYCILPPTKAERPKEQARRDLQRNKPSSKHTNTRIKTQIHRNDLGLSKVDNISSNVKSSRSGALLYIF